MKKTDLAYIAGIVDGEGYVGIKRSKPYECQGRTTPGYHPRIQVRMVDEPAIRFLARSLGGWYYKEKPHCNNGRPLYCYQASDRSALRILGYLRPFLKVKRRQASLLFRLAYVRRHKRRVGHNTTHPSTVNQCDALWLACRKLNGLARFQ